MIQFKDEHLPLSTWQCEEMSFESADKTESDAVEAEARLRLRESPYRELRGVACDYCDGELTLRGRVPSYFLKQIAQSVVFVMERVGKINNRLEVAAGWDPRSASQAG